ncbi:hypothetical protein RhiirC2_856343 [Rhizophagus irregularis]|uniref:Uncharacterized protein n=1 Tax=Rhizophagus irregularis TaxID=588596 RepID=A0A2N1MI35_9GLOM|nr:hypothetical protein RhiirC2_856343 [Rhizophagus irregularis]
MIKCHDAWEILFLSTEKMQIFNICMKFSYSPLNCLIMLCCVCEKVIPTLVMSAMLVMLAKLAKLAMLVMLAKLVMLAMLVMLALSVMLCWACGKVPSFLPFLGSIRIFSRRKPA